MKKEIFRGVATALITPFSNGEIDYTSLQKIIDMQINAGIETLVIGGTTGEAATLSSGEREKLYEWVRSYTEGRAKLIFGTGTNDTRDAIQRTRLAEKIGCEGVLVVTPYYNKGTDKGIVNHYLTIANSTDLPIIVYNVPSRTGVNLSFWQLDELAKCSSIAGIKEATDSVARFVRIASYGDDLPLYSGNDNSIYTALALGGRGVISVVSNLLPNETRQICDAYFSGNQRVSLAKQLSLLDIMDAMFVETNPAPVKYAMSLIELCRDEVRLPLATLGEASKQRVLEAMAGRHI